MKAFLPIRILLLSAACSVLLTGCGTTTKPVPESAPPQTDPVVAASQAAGEGADVRPPSTSESLDEAVERMDFWLKLTGTPMDDSEGPVAFSAHGHPISQRDYDAGLTDFLNGQERTAELETEYRRELENQLLVLRWIEQSGILRDSSFRVDARQTLRQALEDLVVGRELADVNVTEEDLRRLYQERIDQYRTGEKVDVRIILLPTEEEAQEILQELSDGVAFRQLAATRSTHESRSRYGELEPFERGTYIQSFEDKAFELGVGETGTVTTNAGTFIINKLAEIPAQTVPFEEVEEALREELEQRRKQERMDQFLNELRAQYSRRGPSPYGIGNDGM